MTGFARSLRSALIAAPFVLLACSDPAPPPAAPAPQPAAPQAEPAKKPEPAPEAKAEGGEAAEGGEKAKAEGGDSPAAVAEAKEIYVQRCVTCHGANGEGDGVASAALNPKPRNFQDHDWQDSVTDEHIEKIIVEGGAAVGKSVLMPGNPDLADKPEVVAAITHYIRTMKK